jgi:hypothetical protein
MRSVHVNAAIRAYLEQVGLPPPKEADLEKVREKLLGNLAADPCYILSVEAQRDETGAARALRDASYKLLVAGARGK